LICQTAETNCFGNFAFVSSENVFPCFKAIFQILKSPLAVRVGRCLRQNYIDEHRERVAFAGQMRLAICVFEILHDIIERLFFFQFFDKFGLK
jgi:hypothetical protein